MNPRIRTTLIGVVVIIAFDALAALASLATGIGYGWATLGSWILYAGFGYLVARTAAEAPLRAAARTGLTLGLADASLGWAVSWGLGPGRVPGGLSVTAWVLTVVLVTALAAGIASLGGVVARLRAGPHPAV
jgi:hypothetical protein